MCVSARGSQKKVLDLLELELQVVSSYSSTRILHTTNSRVTSPDPIICFSDEG